MADLASYDESLQSSVSKEMCYFRIWKKIRAGAACPILPSKWIFLLLLLLIFKHGRSLFDQLWLFKKKLLSPSFFINFCLEAPMRVGHRHIKPCTFVWEQAVTAFPAISALQGKERVQSRRSLPQGSQGPDYHSSISHQRPLKLVLVFHVSWKAQGWRRRGKQREGFGLWQLIRQEEKSSFSYLDILSFPIVSADFNERAPNLPAPRKIAMPSLT